MFQGTTLVKRWETGPSLTYNIFAIYYYSGSDSENYSGVDIEWECNSVNTSLSLESIVAIVTVSIVLFFCCTCCIVCCFKCTKIWRIQRIRGNGRGRVYQVVPDNSLLYISDENLNTYLPIHKYSKDLVEVGEPLCSICFEEFVDGVLIRKTPCKHIFHSVCMENWINNNINVPTCPICKNNPFQQLLEASM